MLKNKYIVVPDEEVNAEIHRIRGYKNTTGSPIWEDPAGYMNAYVPSYCSSWDAIISTLRWWLTSADDMMQDRFNAFTYSLGASKINHFREAGAHMGGGMLWFLMLADAVHGETNIPKTTPRDMAVAMLLANDALKERNPHGHERN